MGDVLHCPYCHSTECTADPDDDPTERYPMFYCDDCGNGFEVEYSIAVHSPDLDVSDDSLDFDDHYNTDGNPDLDEISGGRH